MALFSFRGSLEGLKYGLVYLCYAIVSGVFTEKHLPVDAKVGFVVAGEPKWLISPTV